MKPLRFDFNNLFSGEIGKAHGIDSAEIRSASADVARAHRHLKKVTAYNKSRISLGLEWTRLPYQSARTIEPIQSMGNDVGRSYENVLFLGIGGSYLGLKAAQDALGCPYHNEFSEARRGRPRIYFEGNNLDPSTLCTLLDNLNPKKTFVVVISKSGETTETKSAFMATQAWLRKSIGKRYGRQVLAITDPGSGSLRAFADEEQRKDPLAFRSFPLLRGVGGRFSEFNMGLFHLAVLGISVASVLAGARAMAERCSLPDVWKNPAYLYALVHKILYLRRKKNIAVLMPFCEGLKSTADWYVQLLSESLGKKYGRTIKVLADGSEQWLRDTSRRLNVGRTPLPSRGTNDLHSIQQNNIEGEYDKVVTFIKVERFKRELRLPAGRDLLSGKRYTELLHLAQEATEWALAAESKPSCTIILPELTPYHWGGLLYFFEMATAFEGELMNINAYDQPGVEGYKDYMFHKLGKPDVSGEAASKIKKHPLKKNRRLIL